MLTLLLAAATTATAAEVQTVDQDATSAQGATATSTATQVAPSNTNISVRVLSPGNDGSVTQTNAVGSLGVASNDNSTTQLAGQAQSGSGTGVQTADQSAANLQLAGAQSAASQYGAKNVNIPIRVGSEGSNGDVTQTNAVGSAAVAKNDNDTTQLSGQKQEGGTSCGCDGSGSTGVQTADQSATNVQGAAAESSAKQIAPKNVNISVRVLSDGSNGDVTQTNAAGSLAVAKNDNDTTQFSGQKQDGSKSSCGCGSTGIQTADQSAYNLQGAAAKSDATQIAPKNVNLSVRVGSEGSNGDVTQTNAVGSAAIAKNDNDTKQASLQSQYGAGDCKCHDGSTGIQTSDQSAGSAQFAFADSSAKQIGASNVNTPIRVKSDGSDGDVTQTNAVFSAGIAANDNKTLQASGQSQAGGSGTGIQTADQKAFNLQAAAAKSDAFQIGASNTNAPIRVKSDGGGGSVTQANLAGSAAIATNDNATFQFGAQSQAAGHDCGCKDGKDGKDGLGIQTLDQHNTSIQGAKADSVAVQAFPHDKCGCGGGGNSNTPVRVKSDGYDGDVTQVNAVGSLAVAANDNKTLQAGLQSQQGGSGTGIQVLDQKAFNLQAADAKSAAFQIGASNKNAPIRVKSDGGGGSVTQANLAGSAAIATNDNATYQLGAQFQASGRDCGCKDGIGIQALGQHNTSIQAADAKSFAVQAFPHNSNSPIRVKSYGSDGGVTQVNAVGSLGVAANQNGTLQAGLQAQLGGSGIGIQALGQKNENLQGAHAFSAALQAGASNKNDPLRVLSGGSGGSVTQVNAVGSAAIAANSNWTKQLGAQFQVGRSHCGCDGIGIQALGQKSGNIQLGSAASAAAQLGPKNSNSPTSVKSHGSGGSVFQLNAAASLAAALNRNRTLQLAAQFQL
jgi:hypothetical protein